MFSYVSDLWTYLTDISQPYEGGNQQIISDGWEWIVDPLDEHYQCRTRSQIIEEVESLKHCGKLIRSRSLIRAQCQTIICDLSLDQRQVLNDVQLPYDTLSSLIRQFVTEAGPTWQQYLIETYPEHEKFFTDNWMGGKYEKNTCGHIIALAGAAGRNIHEEGLQERQLCDIMWSIRIALKSIVSLEIGNSMSSMAIQRLTELISNSIHIYVELHYKTAIAIRNALDRIGIVPEKFRREDMEEQLRLKQIKLDGTDGKFSDGPAKPFIPGQTLIDDEEFLRRKRKIYMVLGHNMDHDTFRKLSPRSTETSPRSTETTSSSSSSSCSPLDSAFDDIEAMHKIDSTEGDNKITISYEHFPPPPVTMMNLLEEIRNRK